MSSAEGLYVYAIVSGVPAGPGTGIDGAPLEVVPVEPGLSAVVHHHVGGPFTGADEDVRRWVLEHGDVVDRLWQRGSTLLPITFNVIVAGTDEEPARHRLELWLAGHAPRLRDRLDRLDGRVELRVEIGLDQEEVGKNDPRAGAARAELGDRPPGVQRLLRRRLDQLERDMTDALADDLYQDYRRRLAAVSEELSENRGSRSEPGVVPVLSVSLLVPRSGTEGVGRVLSAIQAEQAAARIRYSGPWPPYSFADVARPEQPAAS